MRRFDGCRLERVASVRGVYFRVAVAAQSLGKIEMGDFSRHFFAPFRIETAPVDADYVLFLSIV
jgi:hypothetical protein